METKSKRRIKEAFRRNQKTTSKLDSLRQFEAE